MKVFLMHRDRDFDVKPELRDPIFDAMVSGKLFGIANVKSDRQSASALAPPTSDDVLTQDLELETLWSAMAAGDEFLFETAKRAVLSSLSEPEAIDYRQGVLADCLAQPAVVGRSTALRSRRSRANGRPACHGTPTGPTRSSAARSRC